MLEPKDAIALSKQADVLRNAGNYTEAVTCYDQALALDPRHIDSWINKGLTLWELGQPDAAVPCYDAALKLDDDNARAWMNKGNALSSRGQSDEALACYDRALERDPTLATAWYNKGDELGRMNRILEAKACFGNAHDLELGVAQGMILRCAQVLMNEWYGSCGNNGGARNQPTREGAHTDDGAGDAPAPRPETAHGRSVLPTEACACGLWLPLIPAWEEGDLQWIVSRWI